MSLFSPPPKPSTPLALHRTLSPTASVKVSPICLGGISLGNEWSELFGQSEDPFKLLDEFYSQGGNFIDTANVYNNGRSEEFIGQWMETRGLRDQMVVATKFSSQWRAHAREEEKIQSNFSGNSAKSLFVSLRASLRKLRTDYVDVLYVHWWDFASSVEEVMIHLHSFVMARQVLYLGVSDTPAWVVIKANEFARKNGLTPFSIYQGKWNATFRDMEAEIIPMCEDQGMAIVPWAALGGGLILSSQQRKGREEKMAGQKSFYEVGEREIAVSDALEKVAVAKGTTVQAIALAYLYHQSTYVVPIVGVQTTDHVKVMNDAITVKLSTEDIRSIQDAAPFNPLFPMNFLFDTKGDKGYSTKLTLADHVQYKMGAWIDAPAKYLVCNKLIQAVSPR
ncbi:NADP-dependent oxidoreductase domain-containing protein [Aspergillus stella-maris]|uniref:NADP-dependent oxidoreductase domain-containing protein n=1 Tax=Aspergillus stella-maris TaxID=1810926 RepID=UPI003CCE46EA